MRVENISIYRTLDLSERCLPLMVFEGKTVGPTLWLTASVHGNEVVGIEVIHRVMASLEKNGLECGTVYAMPLLNPMANELIQRNTPQDNDNLNRRFPGNPDGGFTDRLAYVIYQTILSRGADVVLDLHTMGLSRAVPFVILDRPENPGLKEPLERLAEVFGLTVTYDYTPEEYASLQLEGSLSGTLLNVSNILSYTVELGPANIVLPEFVEAGVQGVLNVLSHLNMIDGPILPHHSRYATDYPLRRDYNIRASQTGFVDFLVKPGDAVQEGQPLLRVKTILGEAVEVITAPENSSVLALAERNIAFPGTQLMMLALKESAI